MTFLQAQFAKIKTPNFATGNAKWKRTMAMGLPRPMTTFKPSRPPIGFSNKPPK